VRDEGRREEDREGKSLPSSELMVKTSSGREKTEEVELRGEES